MDNIERTKINKHLLLEFFLVLSRMEYALKATGFLLGSERGVKPNWDNFAQEIRDSFNKELNLELLKACNYYLNNPPEKQVVIDGSLYWSALMPNNPSEIEQLLILVRRVRNNLFHGGKYNRQGSDETARNESLLRYGITIVKASAALMRNVDDAYRDAAI